MASSGTPSARSAAALLAVPVVVLTALLRSLPDHAGRIVHPAATTSFADLLVHLATVVACTCSAWLLVITALTAAVSRCAPASGWARGIARSTPRVWRDLVLTLVGVSALSTPASVHAQTDRPSGSDGQATPVAGLRLPDRPSTARTTRPPVDRATTRRDLSAARRLTVRRGDTLWSIAANDLPAHADAAEIARHCSAWYVANRTVIGDDPDLILPGMSLHPPLPPDEGKS